jgi:outer membrane protein assembly factor BamD
MHKFKTLAFLLVVSMLLFSCGEYQKVLNKGTVEDQYKMGVKMYESQKFGKAIRLFEKVTPAYRGKPQMERIQFMVAQSNFNEKNYQTAGYYFDRFAKNYPSSSKLEEASFASALSYKLASPEFSKDPTDTNKALEAFQSFINAFPTSDKLEEANKHYKELRYKLQKKYFEIAKTYYTTADYDMRNYKAAIQAFDNLLEDYLGSDDEMEISKDVTPLTKTTTDDEFYKAILKGIGAPITDENMKFFYAWRQAEGGKAKNNPFNTTQPKPNSTFYNCLKKGISGCKSGVRNYMSSRDGIDATVKTIKNGRYQNIIDALKSGDSAEKAAQALKSSPWGTGQLALKVVQGYNSGATPKPPQIG